MLEDQFESLKQSFIEDGVVYTLLGTFNFFNYEIHYNNIRFLNKGNVCINFSQIIAHDLDFLPEYGGLIDILDESGFECYVAGFTQRKLANNKVLSKVNWLMRKNKDGKVLYTKTSKLS